MAIPATDKDTLQAIIKAAKRGELVLAQTADKETGKFPADIRLAMLSDPGLEESLSGSG